MALSAVISPIAVLLELVICVMGIYAGYARKITFGYLFAVTFLLFALFDYLGQIGVSTDILAILHVVAIFAALIGMYMLVQVR